MKLGSFWYYQKNYLKKNQIDPDLFKIGTD